MNVKNDKKATLGGEFKMKQFFMCGVCKTEKVGDKGLPKEWDRQSYLGFANVNLCEKCKS